MISFTKDFFIRRVVACEIMAFLLIITLIWLDQVADIPHLLLGAQATPVNWRESLFETVVIAPIAMAIVSYTRRIFHRMKYLEGFLPICSSCKRIRDEQGNWQVMEVYIHDRSAARFSHGLCPQCAEKLYPGIYTKRIASSK